MNSEETVKSYEESRIKAMKAGLQLRFHSWTSDGKISIRYQQGRDSAEAFCPGDMRLSITGMDPIAWTGTQGERRKANHTAARIRCGSNQDGTPVWVSFTAYLHRPLPEGSRIQGASFIRRKVGLRYEYRLVITLRCLEPAAAPENLPRLTVGLEWRRQEDGGLRVATWSDTAGSTGEIVLPQRLVAAIDSLDGLQATAKLYQNTAAELIAQIDKSAAPVWFQEATKTLAHWESPMRFMRLWRDWKDQRFPGDEAAFESLGVFRERFLHLYPWQCNLRDQAQRHRREIYRIFAAKAVKQYGTIAIDDRCLVSKGASQLETNIRKWTRMAAASVLRSTLENTAARAGVRVEKSQIEAGSEQTGNVRTLVAAGTQQTTAPR